MTTPPNPPSDDLGFGGVVVERARERFLHRDGTPGVRKYGLGNQFWSRLYLQALAMPWFPFLGWSVGLLLLLNGVFAMGYAALGVGAISGSDALGLDDPFLRALFYSVDVFTGVGTGPMQPVGTTANWLTAIESLTGVLATLGLLGVMLARLTRPRAQIRYTESAVIAPYRDGRALMFRMVNTSPSELYEMAVRVNVGLYTKVDGGVKRRFHGLVLERASVEFFPLHWTVVHPITADSPLAGMTPDDLREAKAEFLILATAIEDTFSTRVTSRTSYRWDEVRWDAKWADVFVDAPDGVITIDVERLDRLDRLAEGATRTPAPQERRG